ncbi:MAG: LLM class flavin-dependent oxidoreductase [Pseudomonadales bacterium]
MTKEMLLCAFDMNCVGHQSQGLWRHPRDHSADFNSMKYWLDLAKTLERGLFDGLFLADVTGVYDVYGGSPDTALRAATQVPTNDPFTIVPAMASVTEHLSFGVTGSIPYEPPYSFARKISSLDHLTKGRIGWNIVTGYLDSAAKGVGQQKQDAHDTRYDIAHEYMQVVYGLWEQSWEDDAVVRDRAKGVFTDPSKVHAINHDGEYFKLNAIHLCEPSPQRTPVLFQAGTSPKGQAFAGEHAECVFIGGHTARHHAKSVASLREQALAQGRDPASLKIFGAITVIVADSDEAAEEKLADYKSYGMQDGALALLSGWTGMDFSTLDMDATVERVESEAIQSAIMAHGSRTVRDWAEDLTVGGAGPIITGSPQTIADKLQQWFDESGLDGFNLAYTVMPESVEEFVDLVVPVLQERGLFKKRYQPGTFREKISGGSPRLQAPHIGASYRR